MVAQDEKYSAATTPTDSTISVRATLKDGVPHYMGLTGDKLLFAVTATATCGAPLP